MILPQDPSPMNVNMMYRKKISRIVSRAPGQSSFMLVEPRAQTCSRLSTYRYLDRSNDHISTKKIQNRIYLPFFR